MDKYRKIEKLGEGTYGVVYKAQSKQSGEIVALKRIRLDKDDEGIPCTAIREISLLKELRHPNIVRLLDILHSEKKLTLVFEYLETDLKKWLDGRDGPADQDDLDTIREYMRQLLEGVAHLHSKMVLHRDLKPQNLLLQSRKGELKIADFGLARAFGAPVRAYSHEVVTLWYRAPDVLLGSRFYSTSIDMWSVGCVFAEMLLGRPLFPGSNERDQLHRIQKTLGTPSPSDWPGLVDFDDWRDPVRRAAVFPGCKSQDLARLFPQLDASGLDLMRQLLRFDPDTRISAADALRHPFITGSSSGSGGSSRK
jgi:cyclin-dependent kinase